MAQAWRLAGFAGLELNAASAVDSNASEKRVKAKDLPIYVESKLPTKPSEVNDLFLQDYVSVVRKEACKLITAAKGPYETAARKWSVAKAHTQSFVSSVEADPTVAIRPGVIALAAFGGLLSAYRKSFIKKTFYTTTAALIGASACYPKEALQVGASGYRYTKDAVQRQWELYNAKPVTSPKIEAKETAAAVSEAPVEVTAPPAAPKPPATATKPLEDFGMSKEEDKDMYTTRSK